jgi:hypothetical protein
MPDCASAFGATVGGATGVQGEAPKFWIVEDTDGCWYPDSGSPPFPILRHALLEFPVTKARPHAGFILRHAARYHQVAARCGLRGTAELPSSLVGAPLFTLFQEADSAPPRALFKQLAPEIDRFVAGLNRMRFIARLSLTEYA